MRTEFINSVNMRLNDGVATATTADDGDAVCCVATALPLLLLSTFMRVENACVHVNREHYLCEFKCKIFIL